MTQHRTFAPVISMTTQSKHRSRKPRQVAVVQHADEPRDTTEDIMQPSCSTNTDDPFMNPVLKEFIETKKEERRRRCDVQPQTLADIKHPSVSHTEPHKHILRAREDFFKSTTPPAVFVARWRTTY